MYWRCTEVPSAYTNRKRLSIATRNYSYLFTSIIIYFYINNLEILINSGRCPH